MRFKSMIAVVLAAATGTLAGAGHAAVVPIVQSQTLFSPQDSLVYNLATGRQAAASTTSYYQLIVDPSWTAPTLFTTFTPGPVAMAASYALADNDASVGAGMPVNGWGLRDIPGNHLSPFHTALLSAGQYTLQINTLPGQFSVGTHRSSAGNYSPVPLPGAVLLFGSSVLAFLGLSRRRNL